MNRSRSIAIAFAAAAALTLVGAGPAQAKPPGTPAIPLNNEQETTGATGGASGFLAYEVVDADTFCYELVVEGLTAPAVAAHIHLAPRNVAGGVVIPLSVPAATSFTTSGCTDDTDAAAVGADPGAYYVNVHTSTFPGGEVRGQLK